MPLSDTAVRAVFPEAARNGNGWAFRCRAHEDEKASATLRLSDSGKLLIHCFVCEATDGRKLTADALGVSIEELERRLGVRPSPGDGQKRRTAANVLSRKQDRELLNQKPKTYLYRDAGGKVLSRKRRFDLKGQKTFRWERRVDRKWVPGLGDTPRVLYRLDKIQGVEEVFVVEGEGVVRRAEKLGLIATTPGGAGDWRSAHVTQLTDASVRQVNLLPDNDGPGRNLMRAVARDSARAGLRVKVVELPGLPIKGDLVDWVEAGHSKEELLALVDATPRYVLADPAASADPPEDPDDAIEWMNHRYFVARDGGKTRVCVLRMDPILERWVLERSTFGDLRNLYANRLVWRDDDAVSLANHWLVHKKRRTYESIVFAPGREVPGAFNLWRGFAVAPAPGDWSRFRKHILNTICGRDQALYRYVKAWMAHAVQHPDQQAEVALVLRGKRGTGKGILGREFGALFGQHFVHIAHARHLTGHFNAHLRDAVLLFADEAIWAGDKQGEGALKMLVTEPVIPIEGKGLDIVFVKNMIHLLMASNNNWVVPAGLEERRFCVIDVSDRRMQDRDYFTAIVRQMRDEGGRAAMLHDLQKFDLTEVDLSRVPKTAALREQKILTMSPVERWWYQKLHDGRLLTTDAEWRQEVPRRSLHEDYIASMQTIGVSQHRALETELGMQLQRLVPSFASASPRRNRGGVRVRTWTFPTLAECRAHFDRLMRDEHAWPKVLKVLE